MLKITSLFILLMNISILSGQYVHKFEVSAGGTLAFIKEELSHKEGSINYTENLERLGTGFVFGVSYNFSEQPICINLIYQDVSYEIVKNTLDVGVVSDNYNELISSSLGVQIEYSFFKRNTLSPSFFIGFDTKSILSKRDKIEYYYVSEYAQFEWGFDNTETKFNSIGYILGAKLKLRISDDFGIYLMSSLEMLNQDYTDWIDKRPMFYTNCLGMYIRISKRKTI